MIESFLIETNRVHTIELKREDIQKKGDMAKLVDATDLIGLSLSMETC